MVRLREAETADRDRLFAWRNDPETRRQSFDQREVTWSEHSVWFERLLASPETRLWIAEVEDEPVGVIRLDPDGEMHLTVDPERRHQGLAAQIIRAALEHAERPVFCRIKPGNERSVQAFRRAGFKQREVTSVAIRLELPYET